MNQLLGMLASSAEALGNLLGSIIGILFVFLPVPFGLAIGHHKGRVLAGFLWTFFLSWIGVLIMLIVPNERERQKHARAEAQRTEMIMATQAMLIAKMTSPPALPAPPPPAPPVNRFRIAKNGQELGWMGIYDIRRMVETGQLTGEDFYLDHTINEWLPLGGHPDLA